MEYRNFHEKLEMQVSSRIAKKKNYLLRVNSWPAKTANIQLIAEEREKRKTHFMQRGHCYCTNS